METFCYELAEGGHLDALPMEDALARWRAGDGAFWIDAHGYDEAELEDVLDQIGVSQFLRQRCLEAGHATAVVAVPKGTFAEWVVFADRAWTRRAQVSALCLKDLLLTMHIQPIEGTEEMHESIDRLELEELSTSSVFCAVLLRHAAETARAARALRDHVLELGQRMDQDPRSIETPELEQLKRSVILTNAIAEEQEEAFDLISQAQSSGLDLTRIAGPIGFLKTTAGATNRLIDRNDGRAENLLRRAQDHKQELLNRRLGLLTVISAIFLPLTLLAGIWGMNFEHMPELDHPYAYPGALIIMAVVALGCAWAFYKRGWFD